MLLPYFQLNKRMGLSPGLFTEILAKLRDMQHAKRKAILCTHKSKQILDLWFFEIKKEGLLDFSLLSHFFMSHTHTKNTKKTYGK